MNAIRYTGEADQTLKLSVIKIDGGTQSRVSVSELVVTEYAQAMHDGVTFPPIVVFHDGTDYWLADGFHRYGAMIANGTKSTIADIRQGTRRDAILFSVGANGAHGLRRTNDDKRRAVQTLLADDEWSIWSDRKIAECAGVSNQFVSSVRLSVNDGQIDPVRTVERNGTVYQQDTSAIGKLARQLAEDKAPQIAQLPQTEEVDPDEITEDDLANDPGFQKAVEALANAKALYDEVAAMPSAEPMTPEREANLRRALGAPEDRANFMKIVNAIRLVGALPDPTQMVKAIPPALNHAIDVLAILAAATWLESFARSWESKGAPE